MANVLEVFGFDDINILQELSDDLEEFLLEIAHHGASENAGYVRAIQRYFREEYGERLEPLRRCASFLGGRNLCVAIDHILFAYDGLQDILRKYDRYNPPEERARLLEEEAKDLLYENLIFPEDMKEYEN